jgi:hypothetical protein
MSAPKKDDALIAEVARMVADWEASNELATEFAERLVRCLRKELEPQGPREIEGFVP